MGAPPDTGHTTLRVKKHGEKGVFISVGDLAQSYDFCVF